MDDSEKARMRKTDYRVKHGKDTAPAGRHVCSRNKQTGKHRFGGKVWAEKSQ